MKSLNKIYLLLVIAMFFLYSCSRESAENIPSTRGVYMLLDTSGTYTQELKQAQKVINYILSQLDSEESFAVARVDTGSFSEKDIVAKVTFQDRPSMANRQKREFLEKINVFLTEVKSSPYTDITGGILQAIEFLNEAGAGHNTILIFSDLKEDLKKGYKRDIPLQVNGYSVVALNVTKLRSDNIDPKKYLNRLESWQLKVESGGGKWSVINDMSKLENILQRH
jgi:hypothetical protein